MSSTTYNRVEQNSKGHTLSRKKPPLRDYIAGKVSVWEMLPPGPVSNLKMIKTIKLKKILRNQNFVDVVNHTQTYRYRQNDLAKKASLISADLADVTQTKTKVQTFSDNQQKASLKLADLADVIQTETKEQTSDNLEKASLKSADLADVTQADTKGQIFFDNQQNSIGSHNEISTNSVKYSNNEHVAEPAKVEANSYSDVVPQVGTETPDIEPDKPDVVPDTPDVVPDTPDVVPDIIDPAPMFVVDLTNNIIEPEFLQQFQSSNSFTPLSSSKMSEMLKNSFDYTGNDDSKKKDSSPVPSFTSQSSLENNAAILELKDIIKKHTMAEKELVHQIVKLKKQRNKYRKQRNEIYEAYQKQNDILEILKLQWLSRNQNTG